MNHRRLLIIAGSVALFIFIVFVVRLVVKRVKRRNYPAKVHDKWLNIQRLCASKNSWALAVVKADKLLEDALKRTKHKGKSIGERLVTAQRELSDNDGVWYAHNLAKKIKAKQVKRLREVDVKKALIGFRQALRDLGVLNGK